MLKSLLSKSSIVIVLSCLVFSCTQTITKPKKVNFKVEGTKMEENFKTLVTCENVNVNGVEITTNGQVSANLDIKIINGSNIPTDKEQVKSLGKSIAVQLKQELADTNDFNTYSVSFVTTKGSGLVTSTSYTSYTFKSAELK